MTTVWLRADGSPSLGLGHILRCIAVAQAARRAGLEPHVATVPDAVVSEILDDHGVDGRGVAGTDGRRWLGDVAAGDLIVFDGYEFSPDLLAAARDTGARTAVITDLATGTFPVDLVVNPSTPNGLAYDLDASTTVLAGPTYAPIRSEFLAFRRERDQLFDTLLVTFGGSDVAGLTEAVVDSLAGWCRLVVVQGPAGPEVAPRADVDVVVSPPSVAAVFDRGHGAIAAAGSTTWELLCMGIPTALVQVADNQASVVDTAVEAGAAVALGDGDDALAGLRDTVLRLVDPAQRRALSAAGLALVDGRGADRIVAALTDGELS